MHMVLTKQMARRIENAEIQALLSRLTAIQGMDGNSMGVDIKKFGHAVAFSVKNIPGPSFNAVKGLRAEDMDYLDAIVDFYQEREIPVQFDITPAHATPELFAGLRDKGFSQQDFHTALYGSIDEVDVKKEPSIFIRTLEKNEFDVFADIYTKGFGMPAFLKDAVAQNNAVLHSNEHWTFYLASIDNKPAGIGVLFVNNGVGSLAASTTIPEFRNKGVQSELILKRLQQASSLNCVVVVGQARYSSVSQHNMERAGMRVAYTKSLFRAF